MNNTIKLTALGAFLLSFVLVSKLYIENSDATKSTEEETSGAMGALQFWSDSRAFPDNDIPPDLYSKAFTQAKRQLSKVPRNILSLTPWRAMGPLNVQGRTISVAINPQNSNTVYVGSASGGLWRSYTGGLEFDWQRVTTGYPVLGVKAIAFDSVDTNTIYIGTGEVYRYQGTHGGVAIRTTRGSYGIGILKTTDGGTTWSKSLDWSFNEERGVQGITLNPRNHNTVYAATTEGIYRSFDAGGTWEQVTSVIMAQNIIFFSDTTIMMASCGNLGSPGTGIYLSYDSGNLDSWFPVQDLPSFSGKAVLEQYKANPYHIYASIADSTTGVGDLYMTPDFGGTWNLIKHYDGWLYGVQGWYSHLVAVHPYDENIIIHAAVDMSRSTDGGSTFLMDGTVHSDHHGYAHDAQNPDVIYEVNDAGVVRSTDFGGYFDDIGYGLQTTQFYNGFAISASDSNFAFGSMQDHIPSFSYIGSMDWRDINIDEVGWCAIDPVNANIIYWCNRQGGAVFKSTNRGYTATAHQFDGFGAWDAPLILSPSNRDVLYFGNDKIHKSTNAGDNWYATNSGNVLDGDPALSMAMSYTNPDTVYVGTVPIYYDAHIFRTTNGGTNWQNITGSLPNRYPMDIAVDPRNSRNVYVAYGGFGTGHVFKSTNSGSIWTDITGTLPDVHTTALIVDPYNSNVVYMGNDIGVFISTNGGSDWNPFVNGLPDAILVADLGICNANGTLRAATHGNGLYERTLYSVATSVEEDLPALPNSIALNQNYPNPFNPTTTVSFVIGQLSFVSLKIFNILGKEIATLVNEVKRPGEYTVQWNAEDFPSGVYFYKIETEKSSLTKKMMLVQ